MTDHPFTPIIPPSTHDPEFLIACSKISWSAGNCILSDWQQSSAHRSRLSLSASKHVLRQAGSMLDQIVAPRIPETDHGSNVAQMTCTTLWLHLIDNLSHHHVDFIFFLKPKPTVRPKDKVWAIPAFLFKTHDPASHSARHWGTAKYPIVAASSHLREKLDLVQKVTRINTYGTICYLCLFHRRLITQVKGNLSGKGWWHNSQLGPQLRSAFAKKHTNGEKWRAQITPQSSFY